MKTCGARQRGNIYVILALTLAAAVAIRFVFAYVDEHWETEAGIEAGKRIERAVYAARDNKALHDAIEEKHKAEDRVAQLERDAAGKVTAADADYQRGLKDGKAKVDSAVARVHAGYRLRDPGGTAGAASKPDGSIATAGDSGQRDGQARSDVPSATGCTLSAERSEALIRLLGEADDVTKQLTACQVALVAVHEFALKLADTLSGIGTDRRREE